MIDLSRNEVPFAPPAGAVRRALLGAALELHRYPVDIYERVRDRALGHFARGHAEDALLTRGVDDAVDLFLAHFADRVPVVLRPEFHGFVERFRARGTPWRTVVMPPDFSLPVNELRALDHRHAWLVSSPHNPTGRDFTAADLLAATRRGAVVLIDRAYREFARRPAANDCAGARIFRFYSFSKAFALAGQRLGVLVGPRRDVMRMQERQIFLGVDAATLLLAESAIASGWATRYAGKVVALREALLDALRQRGFSALATETNFLLVRERRARAAREHLAAHGIRVATTDPQGLRGHLRISVGTARNNADLLRALESWRKG